MKKLIPFLLSILFVLPLYRQAAAQQNGHTLLKNDALTIANGTISRSIVIKEGTVFTSNYSLVAAAYNFTEPEAPEFSFMADGIKYDGTSGWKEIKVNVSGDKKAEILLRSTSGCPVDIQLTYVMYPASPGMRKNIRFINNSNKEVMIEAVEVEKLNLAFNGILFSSYGRQKHLSTYYGDHDDALVIAHDYYLNGGILFANEAPGVLKSVAFRTQNRDISVGLSMPDARYPFRKYIKPSEDWESPSVITMPYTKCSDPWQAMNSLFAQFMNKYSEYTLYQNRERRLTFMYNNYVPFRDKFDAEIIIDLAKAAAECGIREVTIDCGWYICKYDTARTLDWINSCGDWIPHPDKFPDGMKPVFDEMRKTGVEPGLWISVASASEWSEVFRNYPQWRLLDKVGQPTNLHDDSQHLRTMCFGTDWKYYIREKISAMVRDWGLRYVKLDLAAVTSAYIYETEHSGCYATDHPGHKDHAESYIAIYEALFNLFDELHAEFPKLFIDCTFETEGKMQAIDYAFRKHADGNWLTNFEEPYPIGNFRIRNLAWWRSPAMPASSMFIGNRTLDSPEAINELRTMIGTFPIMLGDLRKIPAEKRAEIKRWGDWLADLRAKYDYDLFRSDLPGFGEPAEGSWDAYARLNTITKRGGVVGIFRQGAPDNKRTVLLPDLLPDANYTIKGDPSSPGFVTVRMTGRELAEKGFEVQIPELYAGRLFEVELIK